AWIKRRHPAAFCAGLLNSQPMGFYAPAQLVRDAKEHGVEVRPIDVNISTWDCTLEPFPLRPEGAPVCSHGWSGAALGAAEPVGDAREMIRPGGAEEPAPTSTWGLNGPAIRLGMRLVTGLREDHANLITTAVAQRGPFNKIRDLWLTSQVPVACLK